MIDLQQNIIHRKPQVLGLGMDRTCEWVLVYLPHNKLHPFVVATVTENTLAHSEWHQGTYCLDYVSAKQEYDRRPSPAVGIEAWKDAGISDLEIAEWLSNKIEEIHDCAKSIAHDEASRMTAADFLAEMAMNEDDGQ